MIFRDKRDHVKSAARKHILLYLTLTFKLICYIIVKSTSRKSDYLNLTGGEILQSLSEIQKLFEKYGNIMRTSELRASKIYYDEIQKLLADGIIERIKQGVYHLVDQSQSSEANLIKRIYPDAVLCMNSSLFHYGYGDRTPGEWHLAVDKNITRYKIKIDYPFVKIYYFEPDILKIGLTQMLIDGTTMNIYDKDRIICDCLRYMGKMDKEIFNKAIQSYINDSEKNIPNLMQYAKALRVQKKVKDLIGVWL